MSTPREQMLNFLTILKNDRVTLAFAVLIGGVLTLRFGAPPLPVLVGCIAAVLATSGLKAMRGKR
ncbi:MAG: hypothetical protein LAN64_14875 [Acidobacteriia bacterium]|nr:hypothetical protein [Terriglobia bacterium]